ncbi:DUF7282 domain-containing protein [Halobacterium wangiae]|uniref:DUF7282 domain-containing protein n=1 Tax=Halobacterium wangiae TaxID=2902623 RepID=UPI001E2D5F35|nr:hypothetical protein [Halobacterium wangiae]
MTDENTTRLKLGALLMALTVVLASGTAVAVMSAGSVAQEGDQSASTVTAQDVEAESVQMEDVEVENLTFELGDVEDTEDALSDSFATALGENVEGFEADSVDVGNIQSATVTVEDDTVTVDAEIESITVEGVQADNVTWDRSNGNVAEGMFLGGSLTFQSMTVEELSVGSLSVESGEVTVPDNETTTTTEEEDETTTTEEDDDTTTTTEEEDDTTTTTEEEDDDTTTTTEEEDENETTTTTTTDGDGDTAEATVNFEDQTSDGTTVTISAVALSEDGYVAIHDDSLLEGNVVGSVIGVSDYLEAGSYQDVEVTLYNVSGAEFNETMLEDNETLIAMPHLETDNDETYDFVETNSNQDGPFVSDGEPVTDDAVISVEEDETEDNETTTTTEENDTTTEENETTATDGDGAGDTAEATVNFEDQTSNGTVVSVSDVELSEDGYVAIHDDSLLEGNVVGSVIGVSDYLEAGSYEDLEVTLYNVSGAEFNETMLEEDQELIAMPHLETTDDETYDFVETNGEDDGPFISDGAAVTDDALVTLEDDDTTEENDTTTTTEENTTTTTTAEA